MQSQNPFFDDLARVASGALGALSGLRAEMEAMMRQQFERFTSSLDLVSREEFEVVRAMAIKAREENEALAGRIAALEAKLADGPAKPAPKPKAAPKAKPAAGA
ncbi:MAG: accessory factor UbiK family protein [Magnetospirillum sp.]|nr:accessory factor UbiK family protein [Magnetospirillum sp.]